MYHAGNPLNQTQLQRPWEQPAFDPYSAEQQRLVSPTNPTSPYDEQQRRSSYIETVAAPYGEQRKVEDYPKVTSPYSERHERDSYTTPAIPYNAYRDKQAPREPGFALALYPLSLIAIFLWVVFIAGMLADYESAVSVARSVVQKPWRFDVLPGLFSTVFSQAHLPITAMHLGRLAVSALHSPKTSPRSWTELFWLSNQNWSGPVGMGITAMGMLQMKLRVSATFLLFCIICAIAAITPIILNRAYEVSTVIVDRTVPDFRPNATSAYLMGTVTAESQIGSGSGAWSTGRTIQSLFNASTFTVGGDRSERDMFFAGDIQGMDLRLPGIRHSGHCEVLNDDHSLSNSSSYNNFIASCQTAGYKNMMDFHQITVASQWGVSAQYQSCSNLTAVDSWQQTLGTASATSVTAGAIAWFGSTNGTYSAQGTVNCASTFAFGTAQLNGTTLTFTDFHDEELLNGTNTNGGDPILHPLPAALYMLGSGGTVNAAPIWRVDGQAWFTRMGYAAFPRKDSPGELDFLHPDMQGLADHLWTGITHMANAVVLMSISDDITYSAIQHVTAAGYVRNGGFAAGAYALLVIWLILLIVATVRMYRPTFTDSLDSYAAARLLVGKGELVEGHCCGDLQSNDLLKSKFTHVGDSQPIMDIGHISVDGTGPLFRGRKYGSY